MPCCDGCLRHRGSAGISHRAGNTSSGDLPGQQSPLEKTDPSEQTKIAPIPHGFLLYGLVLLATMSPFRGHPTLRCSRRVPCPLHPAATEARSSSTVQELRHFRTAKREQSFNGKFRDGNAASGDSTPPRPQGKGNSPTTCHQQISEGRKEITSIRPPDIPSDDSAWEPSASSWRP